MAAAPTILLVDDDPDILQAMRTVLESKGYRVVTAGDGNAGLALAEREAPNLVVVDMMMPKQSGFLVLEKLKSRTNAAPRVIVIDRKSTRLNSSHVAISYAVFCLKKK